MFKVVALLKRKEGMSRQEFIDYYQSAHAKIGEKYLTGNAVKYIRRFFSPLPHPLEHPLETTSDDSDYDAIMEMWFEDQAQWEATMKIFAEPAVANLIIEDEKQLFQRDRIRMYCVEEYESDVRGN
jgi:hypothetical protein